MSFPVIKQLVVRDDDILGLDQFGSVWVMHATSYKKHGKEVDASWSLVKGTLAFNQDDLKLWHRVHGGDE